MEARPVNPFYLEAVATYGVPVRTCDHLQYVQAAGQQLDDYLSKFEKLDTRYGGAVPLRGGHGSGKTHLLSWLGLAGERPRSAPTVVYAKADRASFFDLYSQLITQLPQERLQKLIGVALRNFADEQMGKAKATEGLRARLQSPEDVQTLADEGNLDRDGLFSTLAERLEKWAKENQVSPEIARALMKVDSPTMGERAYQWLQGKRVDGLQELGVAHYLGELAQDARGSSIPDLAAIDALETIAALHQFANRPLVILVDQMEVFVRDVDKERQQMLSSLIKKLMEQMGRQNALMFLAGTEDAWDALPRDVSPRLRIREPLKVGSLDAEETRIFLESYTQDTARLSQESVTSIYQLSGGNPREIIRIGYQAFEKLNGFLNKATYEDLVQSASASGTVADREEIALAMADRILGAFGTVSSNLDAGGRVTLDRLLTSFTRPTLALVTVKATDQLSEVQSARRVPAVVEYLDRTWPKLSLPLIVVTIGYSSRPVSELLGRTGAVVQFDEETFPGQLRARVVEFLSAVEGNDPYAPAQDPAPVDPSLLKVLQELTSRLDEKDNSPAPAAVDTGLVKVLERVSSRLDELEASRKADVDRMAQAFTEKTLQYAKPEIEKRELRSKWDLLDALDRLDEVRGNPENLALERQIIRSLLVANEAFLKLKYLDRLGGIYLDWLSQARHGSQFEEESVRAREQLVREMRRVLRDRTLLDLLVGAPGKYAAFAGVAGCLGYILCLVVVSHQVNVNTDWFTVTWQCLATGAFVGLYAFIMLTWQQRRKTRRWEQLEQWSPNRPG